MNCNKVKFDIAFVRHLRNCLQNKVEKADVETTISHLDALITKYNTCVCLQQTVTLTEIPDDTFADLEALIPKDE